MRDTARTDRRCRATRRGPWPVLGEEGGSLVLALLATIIVGGLVTVVVATVLAGQRGVVFDQEFVGALHVAEAGVEQAVYRANAGQDIATTPGDPVVEEWDGNRFSWEAVVLDEHTYEVVSTGVSAQDGVARGIRAVVETEPLFNLAAFADNVLDFQGNNIADSYHSDFAGDPDGWCTGRGRVGSNGFLDFSGGSVGPCPVEGAEAHGTVDGVDMFDWDFANEPAENGRCDHNTGAPNNCWEDGAETVPRFLKHEDPIEFPEVEWVEALLDECVANPVYPMGDLVLSGTIAPATPTDGPEMEEIGDGVHAYCAQSLTFDDHTTLTGADADNPVVFLVADYVAVDGPNRTRVNCDGCGGGGGWHPLDDPLATRPYPRSAALQVYTPSDEHPAGPSEDVVSFSNGARVGAALYAPKGTCGGSAQVHIFGSLICWDIPNVGNWAFHYDEALLDAVQTGRFVVSRWAEE